MNALTVMDSSDNSNSNNNRRELKRKERDREREREKLKSSSNQLSSWSGEFSPNFTFEFLGKLLTRPSLV